MTSIEKLHVSGVRSFNPNPTERQTITFHKPLTIILGKNGAGKTTIIESLLNATTGEMPPGAAAAEKCAFVYDPKAVGESEVKAQIRLIFNGKGGKTMQVIRSYQVTRSRGKIKFETLDSVLACKDESTGKVQSATYRSGDCDRIVPDAIGVPRAVLVNVIFCHQEDCNWPLGPPGEVKKRFDDIFASTRYVAALDRLRETSKEYKEQQKRTEAVLIALREHREQAKQIANEAAEKEEQIRLIEGRNKEIEPRLQQLVSAISALEGIAHKAETMAQELSTVKGRLGEKERALRVAQERRAAAGEPVVPQQSNDELVTLQRTFAAHITSVETELQSALTRLQAVETERRRAEGKMSDARAQVQVSEHSDAQHSRNVARLQEMLRAVTPDFIVGEGEVDGAALQRIAAHVDSKATEARHKVEKLREVFAEAARSASSKQEDVRRAMDAEAKERDIASAQLAALAQRVRQSKDSRPAVHPDTVAKLRGEVEKLEASSAEEAKRRREGQTSTEIQTVLNSLEGAQGAVRELGDKIALSRGNAEATVRMGFLRSTIAERDTAATTVMTDSVVPGLRTIGAPRAVTESGGLPTLQTATETAAGIKSRKLASLQQSEEDARRADHDVTSLKLKLADVNEKLSTAERELISKRASTEAVLASPQLSKFDDVATALRHADDQLVRASRRLTSLQSMAKCYEQFIASAKADKSCVVCKRGLDNAELESFVKVNSERQRTTPEQVATAKNEQSNWQALVDRLRAAAPVAAALQELTAQVPALRASLEATEAELKSREASHADTMTKRRELQRQLEVVDGVVGDLARLEADAAETQRLRSELKSVSESAPGAGATDANGRPIPRDVLQRDFDAKSSDVQKLNAQLLELQRRAATSAGAGSAVEEALSAKRKALSDAEAAARHATEVDARIVEMNSEMEQFKARIEAIAERRKEHTKALATAEERSAQVQKEHVERLRIAEAASREAESNASKLHDSARAVREYLDAGTAEKTAAARRALKAAEDHVRQLDEQATGLQGVVGKARSTLNDQHTQRQAIADGLSLHALIIELEKERATVAHAERELAALSSERIAEVSAILGPELQGNNSLSALSNARERCRNKIGELERQRAQNRGALETLLRDVNNRRATLGQDKFREIDKRYSSTFIKAQTTELAIEDIDKYYRALEKAVSSYHAEKVSQINRIVSDLWRATYRGSDIDTIEIRSEDEGSTATSARRSYRYRVVMKRGDAELDMRGRCSAGQKVLASVIIRMALSEAFCCDCGILALDEPTTNLDDDNARALAESLRDLIQARRAVSHFQLVVITHDEEFVKALGSNHRADSFYFVSKDREGSFSTIQERRFGDLFL